MVPDYFLMTVIIDSHIAFLLQSTASDQHPCYHFESAKSRPYSHSKSAMKG